MEAYVIVDQIIIELLEIVDPLLEIHFEEIMEAYFMEILKEIIEFV